MDVNQQSSSITKKDIVTQPLQSDILKQSDEISHSEIGRLINDTISMSKGNSAKLHRSKRGLIKTGYHWLLGLIKRLNTQENRDLLIQEGPSLLHEKIHQPDNNESWTEWIFDVLDALDPFRDFDKFYNYYFELDEEALYQASEQGRLDRVKYLIEYGVAVNARNIYGYSPLHAAAYGGHLDVIKYLVEKGSDVNAGNNGYAPLHVAAYVNNLDVVKYLTDKGADVNAKDWKGQTPLHMASIGSSSGSLSTVKYLIEHGANVNAMRDNGRTPLHDAAEEGRLEIVKTLVDKGADVDAKNKWNYSTALHLAARKGDLNMIKYLIEKGANPRATDIDGKTPLQIANENGFAGIVEYLTGKEQQVTEISQVTEVSRVTIVSHITEGQQNTTETQLVTSLHIAAREGNLNEVKYFVERGDDINAKDKYDDIPLHLASRWGRLDVVKYLIEKGAEIDIKGGYMRSTPLHDAAENSQLEIVKYLIQKKASVNATNKDMAIPLHRAAYSGTFDVVKYLIESGFSRVNTKDKYGDTPLHKAAGEGKFRIVKYLVEYFKEVTHDSLNTKNNQGNTPLHLAVMSRNTSVMKCLLDNGAYTSIRNNDGNTPLHIAARSYRSRAFMLLVENGANLEIKNKDGYTPVELGERSYNGRRRRRDVSNNSWTNNSIVNWAKSFLPSSTESSALLTSAGQDKTNVADVPEINTIVVNNTILLGILTAGLFNKTQHMTPTHENLLSPREKSIKLNNIDEDMIIKAIQQGEEKFGEESNSNNSKLDDKDNNIIDFVKEVNNFDMTQKSTNVSSWIEKHEVTAKDSDPISG